MSFQIRGWHEQVVEVAFEFVEEQWTAFLSDLVNDIELSMAVKSIPTGMGGPVMSPMVEGQQETVMWFRVECPTRNVARVYSLLDQKLQEHFPRPLAG